MDPITFTAIVAALSAGVATGAGKIVENALVDAYQGLKSALKRKFGDDSEVVKAVDTVEEDPKSDWRQGMLKEMLERRGRPRPRGTKGGGAVEGAGRAPTRRG